MRTDKIIVKNKNTNYPIFIGNGILDLLPKQIKLLCPGSKKVALILDKNVPSHLRKIFRKSKNQEITI